MRAVTLAVVISTLAMSAAAGQPGRSIEIGTGAIVFGNVDSADELLDALVVRVASRSCVRPHISIDAVLTCRYQLRRAESQPFAPDDGIPSGRSGSRNGDDFFVPFYELTIRARALDQSLGLHSFAELEGGVALIDDGEGGAGDILCSVRFGAAWRPRSALAVLVGAGQRLYLVSERYTLPLTLDVVVGF